MLILPPFLDSFLCFVPTLDEEKMEVFKRDVRWVGKILDIIGADNALSPSSGDMRSGD